MTPSRPVVLVVGPALAGVGGVVRALRQHLPGRVVVGFGDLDGNGVPAAVVAVVSAVAPLTRSDWSLIARASSRTDLVVGAVSKIDAHRGWRGVLDADRERVAAWAPDRPSMPWVGVAAAPDIGAPDVADLVALLVQRLADHELGSRNELRTRGLRAKPHPPSAAAVDGGRALQLERMRLLRFVRDRCAAMRVEFRDAASAMPVGGRAQFEAMVMVEARRFLCDLDDRIALAVGSSSTGEGRAPSLATTPSSSRRLETRLMMVLGAGFGMGAALASSRLLAALGPGPSVVGLTAGAVVGLALTVWVVRMRGLLHDRAASERWAAEVTATLKWHADAAIAERLWAVGPAYAAQRAAKQRISPI